MTQVHVVIALIACRGRTIGEYAIKRAIHLSRHFRVSVISDTFPDNMPANLECRQVSYPAFNFLRRYCHVPNELSFAMAVRRSLADLYRVRPFDFVLCHGYTLTKFVGLHFQRAHGTACGMFMHGHIFSRPKGTYDPRLTAFYRWMAPECYKKADLVFALSPAQKMLAVGAGAAQNRVIVAPNGIEQADIGLSEENKVLAREREPESGIQLLFVGRISVEKGVDVLLKACRQLKQTGINFRLNIVGDGPLMAEITSLAKKLSIFDNLDFAGAVERRNLGKYYRDADLLCVPSLSEPLGNVVLEGMISGLPVVASKVDGIPSMIENGVTGFLVPPGDPKALADCIAELSRQRGRLRIIGEKAKMSAMESFSWERINHSIYLKVRDVTSGKLNPMAPDG